MSDGDEDQREDEHAGLDHREVTARHGLHDETAEPGPREHGLNLAVDLLYAVVDPRVRLS